MPWRLSLGVILLCLSALPLSAQGLGEASSLKQRPVAEVNALAGAMAKQVCQNIKGASAETLDALEADWEVSVISGQVRQNAAAVMSMRSGASYLSQLVAAKLEVGDELAIADPAGEAAALGQAMAALDDRFKEVERLAAIETPDAGTAQRLVDIAVEVHKAWESHAAGMMRELGDYLEKDRQDLGLHGRLSGEGALRLDLKATEYWDQTRRFHVAREDQRLFRAVKSKLRDCVKERRQSAALRRACKPVAMPSAAGRGDLFERIRAPYRLTYTFKGREGVTTELEEIIELQLWSDLSVSGEILVRGKRYPIEGRWDYDSESPGARRVEAKTRVCPWWTAESGASDLDVTIENLRDKPKWEGASRGSGNVSGTDWPESLRAAGISSSMGHFRVAGEAEE